MKILILYIITFPAKLFKYAENIITLSIGGYTIREKIVVLLIFLIIMPRLNAIDPNVNLETSKNVHTSANTDEKVLLANANELLSNTPRRPGITPVAILVRLGEHTGLVQ